jgi:hypothetical protein
MDDNEEPRDEEEAPEGKRGGLIGLLLAIELIAGILLGVLIGGIPINQVLIGTTVSCTGLTGILIGLLIGVVVAGVLTGILIGLVRGSPRWKPLFGGPRPVPVAVLGIIVGTIGVLIGLLMWSCGLGLLHPMRQQAAVSTMTPTPTAVGVPTATNTSVPESTATNTNVPESTATNTPETPTDTPTATATEPSRHTTVIVLVQGTNTPTSEPPGGSQQCNPGEWTTCGGRPPEIVCPPEYVAQCGPDGQWGGCQWDPATCGGPTVTYTPVPEKPGPRTCRPNLGERKCEKFDGYYYCYTDEDGKTVCVCECPGIEN